MRPVDHVVAQVQGIGVRWKELHTKRVYETRLFEGRVPPRRSLEERAANRLWRPTIEVIDQRLERFRPRCAGIFLLQPMPSHPHNVEILVDGRREVLERKPECPDSWVRPARLVTVVR